MKTLVCEIFGILLLLNVVLCNHGNDSKPHKDKYLLVKRCDEAIHKQINEEMHASLVYATMAAHFGNNKVARKGLEKFFNENSLEEREHAHKFIDYLLTRGARFTGFEVKMPIQFSWGKALDALEEALSLEKQVNNKLLTLHDIASSQCADQHLMDFIEGEFLDEQVKSISKLQRFISIISGMDTPMGEFLFDQQLLKNKDEL